MASTPHGRPSRSTGPEPGPPGARRAAALCVVRVAGGDDVMRAAFLLSSRLDDAAEDEASRASRLAVVSRPAPLATDCAHTKKAAPRDARSRLIVRYGGEPYLAAALSLLPALTFTP